MSSSGLQIRAAIANHRPQLCRRFQATGGSTTTAIDTVHLRGDTLPTDIFDGWWIRFTTGQNAGYVGRIDQFSGLTGTITFSPAAGNAVANTDQFEVWRKHPDQADQARDFALVNKCKDVRLRPASVLAYCENWPTAAYDATAGGKSNATPSTVTLDFPQEYQTTALRVTNSGAAGYESSEAFGVQPEQIGRVFGWVRASAQTGSIRVRDVVGTADITVAGTATFTGLGWQYIDFTFVVPASCYKIQLWCGGASASFVGDFCGIGLLMTHMTQLTLPSTVVGTDDVGRVFQHNGASLASTPQSADDPALEELAVWRTKAGARVLIRAPGYLAAQRGVYVELVHHYSALQADYLSVANRTTGDAATTDCPLEYIEAATVVELLKEENEGPLAALLAVAMMDLAGVEDRFGPPPAAIPEPARRPQFRRSRV